MRLHLASLLCGLVLASASAAHARPNILWIVSDDQGYGDLSSLGHPVLRTPHLDQLKRESVWLKNFYVAPLCAPTRAALMTGRHNFRTGVWDTWASRSNLAADEVTAAEHLREAGYATAQFGKWHLGENYPFRPIDQGFDRAFVWNNLDRFAPTFAQNGVTTGPYPGFLDEVVTDEAIRFLREGHDRPFFAYVALFLPHTFWAKQVPEADVRRFADVAGLSPSDREIMGMIENVDRNVGRLLAALREGGLDENTIVIFHSDNGPTSRQQPAARFNAGLRGAKGQVYEGGIRVPCFVRWPGRIAPRVETARAAGVDLLPTLLEAAGVSRPVQSLDGISLLPLLRGDIRTLPERFIVQQQQPQKSGVAPQPYVNATIIGPRFKLLWLQGESAPELYDLEQDAAEANNLATREPGRVQAMKVAYDTWFQQARRERGFDAVPPIVGHPAQPLFRESMIQVQEETGIPLEVARAGEYRIRLRQVQTGLFPAGGWLGLTDGTRVWKGKVDAGATEIALIVPLPAGRVTLRPWAEGRTDRPGYVPVGRDPGCRDFTVELITTSP
jgi:arylsulfatase A-like enzyme